MSIAKSCYDVSGIQNRKDQHFLKAFFIRYSPDPPRKDAHQILIRFLFSNVFFENSLCCPVSVPHKTRGFCPEGPVMVKESAHAPVVVVSVMSKLSKSNLI